MGETRMNYFEFLIFVENVCSNLFSHFHDVQDSFR